MGQAARNGWPGLAFLEGIPGTVGGCVRMNAGTREGELKDIHYLESTDVDHLPYEENPAPPEGIFWYLWMGRLLFRDSNWNPHFPDAALQVTELYHEGMLLPPIRLHRKGEPVDDMLRLIAANTRAPYVVLGALKVWPWHHASVQAE